jgi:hypothetical protein
MAKELDAAGLPKASLKSDVNIGVHFPTPDFSALFIRCWKRAPREAGIRCRSKNRS